MSLVKEEAIRLIQSLPEDCSIEDIQYHLYIRQKVEHGVTAIEAGQLVSQDECGTEHRSMGQVYWTEPALGDIREIVTLIAETRRSMAPSW
jgi:hypothetical protein